jgi:hypothetical protein
LLAAEDRPTIAAMDGFACTQRAIFMAESRHSANPSYNWALLVVAAFVAVILLGAGAYLGDIFRSSDPPQSLTPIHAPVLLPAAPPRPTPTPSPSADLVAAALKVKPLEDIHKGDRVIYQGHVCRWLLWNLNINTSTIKCAAGKAFQIQTGRLTPVELATGVSKLKVRH